MSKRHLWETRVDGVVKRHPSKDAVYRHIQGQASAWSAGAPGRYVNVYLDERDGRGWQPYEEIDLRELNSMSQAPMDEGEK